MTQDPTFLQKALTRQWSFFWAGITFGVAQIIYMLGLWLPKAMAGKDAVLDPITVTTDLGRMFRGLELSITKLLHLPDFQLYGNSVDGVASGGAFYPGIGWAIFGMALGGWLVTRFEREPRTWAYYPKHVLIISFFGGAFFSYGTRLAGGCTLNHLLGGIPMMNIHSTITVVFMAMGGAFAFWFLSKVNMAPYFKHQETKSYVSTAGGGESLTWKEGYNPRKRVIFWVSGGFAAAFFLVAVVGGIFNPEALQHLSDGKMVAFGKSIGDKGMIYALLTLVAGVVAGFGMAKSGFGTECSLVSAEVAGSMTKKDSLYAKIGVPKITRTLMRSYLPLIGLMASWVVMLGFILFVWFIFGTGPGFEGALKYQTTLGSILGGFLLGMGAVMLVGCEIRSYMRIGMGYLNTWVGFMGFAVGYLPFTLFYDGHKAFLQNTLLIETYKWYQLVTDNMMVQKIILLGWWVVLFAGLVWAIRKGAKNTGSSVLSLRNKSTEDLQLEIDAAGKAGGGLYNGAVVPVPVPMAPETRG